MNTAILRRYLVVVTALAMASFSGFLFGWSSLQLIFESESVFLHQCQNEMQGSQHSHLPDSGSEDGEDVSEPSSSSPCAAQLVELNFVFVASSSVVIASALLNGFIADLGGPRVCVLLAGCCEVGGALLLSAVTPSTGLVETADGSTGYTRNSAILWGAMGLAVGGSLTHVNSYAVGFILPTPEEMDKVIALYSILFDASSGLSLLMWLLHRYGGLSMGTLFQGYACYAALIYASMLALWTALARPTKDQPCDTAEITTTTEEGTKNGFGGEKDHAERMPTKLEGREEESEGADHGRTDAASSYNAQRLKLGEEGVDAAQIVVAQSVVSVSLVTPLPPGAAAAAAAPARVHDVAVEDRSLVGQVSSREFLFAVLFMCCNILRTNVYLGANKDLLESYGDRDWNYAFAATFGVALPFSALFAPCVASAMVRLGFLRSFHVVNLLGFVFVAVVLVPVLEIQPLAFLAFSFYRAMLFSTQCAWHARKFGPHNVGRIHGLVFLVAGGANSLQQPAIAYTHASLAGDVRPLFIGLLALSLPSVALVFGCRRRIPARDEIAREEAQHTKTGSKF